MSISQSIAFRRRDLPTTSALEAAARGLGFDLTLDPADLSTHSGFLPATLGGRPAGFEWFPGESIHHPEHAGAIGDETEGQSAMACAAAMLRLTRGMYFDEDGKVLTTPEPLVEEVRAWIGISGDAGRRPASGKRGWRGLLNRLRRSLEEVVP